MFLFSPLLKESLNNLSISLVTCNAYDPVHSCG